MDSCHIVKKAIPYFDPILYRTITPINPTAYKMEYYFSDIFPLASSISVAVIPRSEYIPIINPPGETRRFVWVAGHPIATPEKAVEALANSHLVYLQKNGIKVTSSNPCENGLIEISSLVSIREEGLHKLQGITLELPCVVYDASEVELKKESYTVLSDSLVILTEKREGRAWYVVV